jgi:uncharacterized membrane protein
MRMWSLLTSLELCLGLLALVCVVMAAYPIKRALIEIHHEPGATMALAGSLLFVIGNVLLLVLRSKQLENEI